jgi:hypothetical protein
MATTQAGDKTVYETLLHDCIPFIKRVARSQRVHSDCIDDYSVRIVHPKQERKHGGRCSTKKHGRH